MNDTVIDLNSGHDLTRLTPETLERRLAQLIRAYVRTGSPLVASSVVRHIESLCGHPGFAPRDGDRCAYLRLNAHWRWLARCAAARSQDVKKN